MLDWKQCVMNKTIGGDCYANESVKLLQMDPNTDAKILCYMQH